MDFINKLGLYAEYFNLFKTTQSGKIILTVHSFLL